MSPSDTVPRHIDRVETRVRLGPDAQVDDKAIVFAPADPTATDPFLALSEDWFSSPGFEWHPHRGIETVTTVLEGGLEHGDNIGNAGVLTAGDVQWMTAGRGIIHRELAYRDQPVHTLQLWVNLPARSKMVDTRYQDIRAADQPRVEGPGSRIDVVSGRIAGVEGPAQNHWPIQGAIITLEPGSAVDYVLDQRDRAFAYVLGGTAMVGRATLRSGQVGWSDPTLDPMPGDVAPSALPVVALEGTGPTRVMVYSGPPIGQPVVLGGPFVMNTEDEIREAYEDYRRGEFGTIPDHPRQ